MAETEARLKLDFRSRYCPPQWQYAATVQIPASRGHATRLPAAEPADCPQYRDSAGSLRFKLLVLVLRAQNLKLSGRCLRRRFAAGAQEAWTAETPALRCRFLSRIEKRCRLAIVSSYSPPKFATEAVCAKNARM